MKVGRAIATPLIYFDQEVQSRALGLVRGSPCPRSSFDAFEPFAEGERIYRVK